MSPVGARPAGDGASPGDPHWYQDAIVYQLRIRSFYDSDADGIGDLRGLTEKLDYLHDLGVTALWLLPFYPSPLRDDGYDIADYTAVDPECGTLAEFRELLRQAHRRGLRVITEFILNHTSDQHRWFREARKAPAAGEKRAFYVWSATPDGYRDARIIFKDFEPSNWTWDPVAGAYYWHRFYAHQPDLNFDNPDVRKAVVRALDFWLKMGVDGLRLDAVPYLYEREGTSCENLPETHAFLRELRRHLDARYADRMLLAEANQWPEDAVAYFGGGDECHMAFHFPIMPRLFMALHMEDRYPILDILAQTPKIPAGCQWAIFLRNHDELTLEMVTDEERDYMYRMYASDARARINLGIRRRLAPLLGNGRRRIELMNALLFSLPGTPVLYYGDEIGMGDNIYLGDRNGVRTPMQWSADKNAGFSRANPQRLVLPVIIDPEYHYETVNVEAQQANRRSLLWWTKRLIAMRKRYRAFGRGEIEFLEPRNRKVLAFLRRWEDETLLVVANLSRFVQYVELDLSRFRGRVAFEVFGRTPFPPIGELPYLLTLGPHNFYWFSIEEARVPEPARPREVAGERPPAVAVAAPEPPLLPARGGWESILQGETADALERALPAYLRERRWFAGKAREIRAARVADLFALPGAEPPAKLALIRMDYAEGEAETYVLPLAFVSGEAASRLRQRAPQAVLARLEPRARDGREPGLLVDALYEEGVCRALLEAVGRRRKLKGSSGEILAVPTAAFRALGGAAGAELAPRILGVQQSNTSIAVGERFVLKLFRRVPEGVSPDLEMGRFLTDGARFAHTPAVAGYLEHREGRGDPRTIGILHAFVRNEGDAWTYTLDEVQRFLERALSRPRPAETPEPPQGLLALAAAEPPEVVRELMGTYLESARQLGRRTAELHAALASADDPAFAPEPFTPFYQRSLYQSLRNLCASAFQLLRERLAALPADAAGEARELLPLEPRVLQAFRPVLDRRIDAVRMRFHGDYHLGQILYTGRDFVIIDFEGEPGRSLGERRIKRSPLVDVAGMLRSFHYAASTALSGERAAAVLRPEDVPTLEPWARLWHRGASGTFLRAYLEGVRGASFLPRSPETIELLLGASVLEKSLYELRYELNNRPGWAWVPARGVRELVEAMAGGR